MYKRILSVLITSCLLFNIFPVFGEEILQDNTKYGIINTGALTDENVIYNALQNNKVSLLDDADDEITANFDVVFGFDMSADMYKYDYNGDMTWLDEFKALEEQVPEGTRFAAALDEGFTQNIDIDGLKEKGYSGSGDIISMLDSCINTFDDSSADRNKIVIATASNISDSSALQNKMDEMIDYGVIPFVFVLNSEPNEQLDNIENVSVCESDLNLRLSISDLYLSFGEFNNAILLSEDEKSIGNYISDFREKHEFSSTLTENTSGGILLAEIMNIYGCVPLRANISETNSSHYDLLSSFFDDALQLFLKADNKTFSVGSEHKLTEFKNTWEEIFNIAKNNVKGDFWVSSNVNEVIEKNLKRRFPVVAYDGTNYKIIKNSSDTNADSVFDTYNYLMSSLIYGNILTDEAQTQGDKVKITISYPNTYNIYGSTNGTDNIRFSNNSIELNKDNHKVSFDFNDNQDEIISTYASYTEGITNICNANKRYIARIYSDVKSSSLWYYDFVFEATNEGIIKGYDDGTFRPEPIDNPPSDPETYGKITRGEFIKMVLFAVGFDLDEESEAANLGRVWSQLYLEQASDMGLLIDYVYRDYSANINEETRYNYQQGIITRKEASYILSKLFVENEDNSEANKPKVPSIFYKYDTTDSTSDKLIQWYSPAFKDVSLDLTNIDNDTNDDVNRAIFQMYANGVINGYEDSTFRPENSITRAEVCKIIVKSLFDLEDVEMIQANVFGDDYGSLNIGEEVKDSTGSNGKFIYSILVDKDGRYSEYIDGTYSSDGRLYKISLKGDGIQYVLKDMSGIPLQPVAGESDNKYRLKTGQEVKLEITGSPNQEFTTVINDCWSDSKKVYIVLYDSYDNQFENELGSGVTSRYHDSKGKNYDYTEEFFKTYFELLGNRQAVFMLGIRDIYFDAMTGYTVLKDEDGTPTGEYEKKNISISNFSNAEKEEHYNTLVSKSSEKYNNIISCMYNALDKMNASRTEKIPTPEIYIDSPDIRNVDIDESKLEEGVTLESAENALIDKYSEITRNIYEKITRKDAITGMGFGREDPNSMYKENTTVESIPFRLMKKVSEFAREQGKKVLWAPYSGNTIEWENIGKIVNTAKYNLNGQDYDVLDYLIMQPGLFFSDYDGSLDNDDDERIKKQKRLKSSVISNIFLDDNGDIIGYKKDTKTNIIPMMEYDISLVTGRLHNTIENEPILPKNICENFIKTYIWYKDLINNENTPIGIYVGGPNEQDYKNKIDDNSNKHTIINHPSALSEYKGGGIYVENGENISYNTFFTEIPKLDKNEEPFKNPLYGYNVNYYNNRLIYDITKGLLYNHWSELTKNYLDMDK